MEGFALEASDFGWLHTTALETEALLGEVLKPRPVGGVDRHQVAFGEHMEADRFDHRGREHRGQEACGATLVGVVDTPLKEIVTEFVHQVPEVVEEGRSHQVVVGIGGLGQLGTADGMIVLGQDGVTEAHPAAILVDPQDVIDVEHVRSPFSTRKESLIVYGVDDGQAHEDSVY